MSYQVRSSSASSNVSSSPSTASSSTLASSHGTHVKRYSNAPRVEILRCSRCAKCVETIVTARDRGVEEESAGMVRFGINLYYCERCARLVGYK